MIESFDGVEGIITVVQRQEGKQRKKGRKSTLERRKQRKKERRAAREKKEEKPLSISPPAFHSRIPIIQTIVYVHFVILHLTLSRQLCILRYMST